MTDAERLRKMALEKWSLMPSELEALSRAANDLERLAAIDAVLARHGCTMRDWRCTSRETHGRAIQKLYDLDLLPFSKEEVAADEDW